MKATISQLNLSPLNSNQQDDSSAYSDSLLPSISSNDSAEFSNDTSITGSDHILGAEVAENKIINNLYQSSHSNESLIKPFINFDKTNKNYNNRRQKVLRNKRFLKQKSLKQQYQEQKFSANTFSLTQNSAYQLHTIDNPVVTECLDYFGDKLLCTEKKLISLCERCLNNWNQFLLSIPEINLQQNKENIPSNNKKLFDFKDSPLCSAVSLDDVEIVQDSDFIPQPIFIALNDLPNGHSDLKNMQCDLKKSTCFISEKINQKNYNKMKILMSINQFIPKIVNYDFSKSFVINEKTNNVVSLPFHMYCRSSPLTSKVKVVIIGSVGVGKTTIIFNRQSKDDNSFNPTIGVTYFSFDININESVFGLQVWGIILFNKKKLFLCLDTAGQERFRCMVPMYMRNAATAIIVYDVTRRSSFDEIDDWIAEIKRVGTGDLEPNLVIVGNKADLEMNREVASGEGYAKAVKLNAKFFEVSAVNEITTSALFAYIAEDIYQRDKELGGTWKATECLHKQNDYMKLQISLTKQSKAKKCCLIS